jgi:chromosome segregation ATPase
MWKKVLIGALAVVVGLALVKGTWLGSHLRSSWRNTREWVKEQVSPEQEINRLRLELRNLERDDDKFYDRVARLSVEVEKQEREIARLKDNLAREEVRIRKLRDQMGASEFVIYEGHRYSRDDLRSDALAFQAAEESLKSKEANLQARRKHLALERKQLTELRTTREEMATALQQLETALAEERHAQAASQSTINDRAYQQLKADMESVRDRIEVLKKKRQLRGELKLEDNQSRTNQRDAQADKFLETRFGGKSGERIN